jgi:hypothetical protein
MVEIRIESGEAIFEIEGSHKLWALKSRLSIPLAHITGVRAEPNPPMGFLGAVKIIGADIPHVFRAGSFYQVGDGGIVFWDVRHAERCIAIDLDHEHFKRLYLEVEDPASAIVLLTDAVRRNASAGAP